jgi:hypothetical protein
MELAKGRVQFADSGTGGTQYSGSTTIELEANFITLKDDWSTLYNRLGCIQVTLGEFFCTHISKCIRITTLIQFGG